MQKFAAEPAARPCIVLQVASLTEELEHSRGGVRDQLKEKDAKINSLIEELGNSQAMLNDKVAELAEVPLQFPPCLSGICCWSLQYAPATVLWCVSSNMQTAGWHGLFTCILLCSNNVTAEQGMSVVDLVSKTKRCRSRH